MCYWESNAVGTLDNINGSISGKPAVSGITACRTVGFHISFVTASDYWSNHRFFPNMHNVFLTYHPPRNRLRWKKLDVEYYTGFYLGRVNQLVVLPRERDCQLQWWPINQTWKRKTERSWGRDGVERMKRSWLSLERGCIIDEIDWKQDRGVDVATARWLDGGLILFLFLLPSHTHITFSISSTSSSISIASISHHLLVPNQCQSCVAITWRSEKQASSRNVKAFQASRLAFAYSYGRWSQSRPGSFPDQGWCK